MKIVLSNSMICKLCIICFTNNLGDRYSAEPKNFDDAYDEFDEKTHRRSSFRKFKDKGYLGTKSGEYKDDASNIR